MMRRAVECCNLNMMFQLQHYLVDPPAALPHRRRRLHLRSVRKALEVKDTGGRAENANLGGE